MNSREIQEENQDIEIDLGAFLLKLKSNWKKLIVGLLVGALLALGYSTFLKTPMYQSTAMVYLRGSGSSLSLEDLQLGTQLTKDYEIIFKSRPVMEATIAQLRLDLTPDSLADSISISNPEDSRILQITTTNSDPTLAKDIVNTVMEEGVDTVLEIDAQEPYIIEKGIASTQKVGMSRSKMTLLGGLAGLVLMAGYVFIRFILSDTIKSADDVEKVLGIPTLAVVLEDDSLNYSHKVRKNRKQGKV